MRLRPTFAALLAAPLTLALAAAGCDSGAENAIKESTGVEEGEQTQVVKKDQRDVIVEDIERVKDAETGEVLGEEVTEIPGTITETEEVVKKTKVETGDEETTTSGGISPDDVDEN